MTAKFTKSSFGCNYLNNNNILFTSQGPYGQGEYPAFPGKI